jgi:hypothetical protein
VLLSEIFPTVDLISLCHPIQKRIVAWGPDAAPMTLAHSAWVVSEADLSGRLWQQVTVPGKAEECPVGLEFSAYPRIAFPLCGDGWLACGAAAMAFDPLCGEGTGNAARQAYLATAVVGAVRDDEPVEELLAHYTSRQMHGFLRHLQICLSFYQTGGSTSFWQSETALLGQGIEWAERVLRESAKPATHRLIGRQLKPVENKAANSK